MTKEVLAGDRNLAIALLRHDWESHSPGKPAVHEIACVGRIASHEELEGGKYNLVLAGTHRIRLVRELEHTPYRLAEVARLEEHGCDDHDSGIVGRRNHLGGLFSRFTELANKGKHKTSELVPQLGFEALVNLVASTLNIPAEDKQALLEMDDITHRCDVLIPVLQRQLEAIMLVRDFEHLKPENPGRN